MKKVKEEIKKIPGDKLKHKHNDPKSMGHSKTVLSGKYIAIQAYLRKQEKSQIKKPKLTPKGTKKSQGQRK